MEEVEQQLIQEIKAAVIDDVHNYLRELLGDIAYMSISILFIILGILLLAGAISNSNILLGDPQRRDKSQLGEMEYRKTRTILRTILSIVGTVIIIYNILGLLA